jgi:tricorn protease
MNANGGDQRKLTSGGDNRYLDVSPDGKQIAYVALGDTYPVIHLMIMNADGSNARALLSYHSRKQRDDPGRFVYRPDWSPDGVHLAFGADDDNDGLISILIVESTDGQVQPLIRDGNDPAWSPDGKRSIYKPAGKRQILYVANTDGDYLYQLTGSGYNAWSPDWGP